MTASTAASGIPYGSLTARISSASETITPGEAELAAQQPGQRRGRQRGGQVAGQLGNPQVAWHDRADPGRRSRPRTAAGRAAPARSAGRRPWRSTSCVSMRVLPWPGKCLAHAATPADCRPVTAAAACRATRAVSAPNDRVPMTGLSAAVFTSTDGARSTLIPSAAQVGAERAVDGLGQADVVDGAERRVARVVAAGQVRDPGDVAALLVDGDQRLGGRRAQPAVSAASCAGPAMFGPNRVTPARPVARARPAPSPARPARRETAGSGPRRPAGPGRGRRCALAPSSLHRPGDQPADQAAPDDQEEDHHRDRVHRGRGHDRPPLRRRRGRRSTVT